ncbi:MAG: glutamyl-tRNA reductase, partial [Ferruginibacter sp.]
MQHPNTTNIDSFFMAGINYKKTDASIRGQFAINCQQYEQVISNAPSFGICEFLVLSTCNRTEIYGFTADSNALCALLCSQTEGSLKSFMEMSYVKCGVEAIEHLFNVAAGLDSQILGDYEIVGQIKQSTRFSKQRNFIGAYLERMINDVLKASKKIRTCTALSTGTVSVSFAAIQYIKENFTDLKNKRILLLGTGKIGSNTCKNLADYLPGVKVTLVNRTKEKARELAEQNGLEYDGIENMGACISNADIILVATNANEPILFGKHFTGEREQMIIDLSVPSNVAPEVKVIDKISLIGVDELSKIKDKTL